MRLKQIFVLSLILPPVLFIQICMAQESPLTVAESSRFTATSRYTDVITFINELQQQSRLIRRETLCTSTEGREVPLLIIGDPVPCLPQELRHDPRAVIYIQGNIHAGEVEGKEACLMLARDILHRKSPFFLDKLVILMAPIFNADGNEKISPRNRRNQVGPKQGVGVRYNGQNLDLNRDAMKLETPEMQGLVKNVLLRWDPLLLIDCHTTNGSYHEEPVTFSWGLNPNGNGPILHSMRGQILPAMQEILKKRYHTLSIPYGNFVNLRQPEKGWRTFSHLPRYLTNYVGLRNRLAILIENYAYANFKTRVMGNYHFLLSILEYCHDHTKELQEMVQAADRAAVARGRDPVESDSFAVAVDLRALKQKITISGWKMKIEEREGSRPRIRKTEVKKTYRLPYFADFVAKKKVKFPYGYFLPSYLVDVVDKLKQHGIVVESLLLPVRLRVEIFQVEELKSAERLFQGHHLNSVKGQYKTAEKEFPVGTYFVPTAQPLGTLAAALLEPESDDGLLVWNFFDRYLVGQWRRQPRPYPVFKRMQPVNLAVLTLQ